MRGPLPFEISSADLTNVYYSDIPEVTETRWGTTQLTTWDLYEVAYGLNICPV